MVERINPSSGMWGFITTNRPRDREMQHNPDVFSKGHFAAPDIHFEQLE